MSDRDRRFPRWVYAAGDEPDPRFSLANERTYLAWIRTALAFLAGSVVASAVQLDLSRPTALVVEVGLALCGAACAVRAWVGWARAERAMRLGAPLPGAVLGVAAVIVLVVAVALAVVAIWR